MNPTLDFSVEQMREYGYRVIDQIVRHLSTLGEQRVGAKANPTEILRKYRNPPPEDGADFRALLEQIESDVLQNTMHVNHPRFFAYVPGPGNFIGAMADALVSGYNVFAGTWIGGSGAAAIELETIDWMRTLCGFPETAGGLFVSGGTMANLTALAVARHAKLGEDMQDAMVYFSDQTHSSVEKDLRVLGFSRRQIRKLPSDGEFRLTLHTLRSEVEADLTVGKRPFCVVANAGTTNTGAVDPLADIAQYCRAEGLWLHIDGAYGAAAVICDRGRAILAGLEMADSLSLDPHKWLFQPFECGCLLVRDSALLGNVFQVLPEYLKDTHHISAEINFADRGIQLTRSFQALKLWLSLKTFGLGSFRKAVERGFELAELIEAELEKMPGWEIVTKAQMGVICFRFRQGDDAFHFSLVQKILADGYALVTSTNLNGRTLLRMCPINPRTTDAEIVETLRRIDRLATAPSPVNY